MKYVLIRDDDTHALTPVDYLERLYRPFHERGLPVNLAVIPNVNTGVRRPDGRLEGFLEPPIAGPVRNVSLADGVEVLAYLKSRPGYCLLHHGYEHAYFEFNTPRGEDAGRWLDEGKRHFRNAGLVEPATFVAPYDKVSRASMRAIARRFRVLSTGWFELGRLPMEWWWRYAIRKMFHKPHWQMGGLRLLSHPGCLLSFQRDYGTMLDTIRGAIERSQLTVLVTHWWEYFREGTVDTRFIEVLHRTAEYLASREDVKVIRFSELEGERTPVDETEFALR